MPILGCCRVDILIFLYYNYELIIHTRNGSDWLNKNKIETAFLCFFAGTFLTFSILAYVSFLSLFLKDWFIVFFEIAIFAFVIWSIGIARFFFNKNRKNRKNIDGKIKGCTLRHNAFLSLMFGTFIGFAKYYHCYGTIDVEQIWYHTFVGSDGMDFSMVISIGVPTIIAMLVGFVVFGATSLFVLHDGTVRGKKVKRYCRWASVIAFVAVVCYALYIIPVFNFLYYQQIDSTFIVDNYVDPNKTNIEFPEEKRNLIHIYMESMENTFADIESGGAFEENLMPEITQLAKENISFSNKDTMGGALRTYGMTYTTAGIFAQSFGLPLKVGSGIKRNPTTFMPNTTNIYDILDAVGYSEYVIAGSDIDFGGRAEIFASHGDVTVYDYKYMVETGFVAEDYKVFWGVEDKKLYDFSKLKISEISKQDEPFFVTIETVDTHNPNGYLCSVCDNKHDSQYANVVSCASKQIYNFVQWAKEQIWYENTTIVISGDHCSMKNDFFSEIDKNYQRTTLNIIINPSENINNGEYEAHNRQFSSADMFPTTLVAIGCAIDGNKLALGTNLFSNEKTLYEKYGYEYVNEEFRKRSTFSKNVFEG